MRAGVLLDEEHDCKHDNEELVVLVVALAQVEACLPVYSGTSR